MKATVAALVAAAACVAQPPATHQVNIAGMAFVPPPEVVAGDTVVWTNRDLVPHTVTAANGAWDSGNLNQGEVFRFVAPAPGDYEFICAYHPSMTGRLVVTAR